MAYLKAYAVTVYKEHDFGKVVSESFYLDHDAATSNGESIVEELSAAEDYFGKGYRLEIRQIVIEA